MSEPWIGEPSMFDFDRELRCEKTGFCELEKCKFREVCHNNLIP